MLLGLSEMSTGTCIVFFKDPTQVWQHFWRVQVTQPIAMGSTIKAAVLASKSQMMHIAMINKILL